MADVFISYASEDRNRVRPLAEALQQRGFNVWWDRSLAAGQDYAAVIERELRNAKAVIVVWTAASAASTFVRDEAGLARDQGRLIPILFDRVDIPLGFGAFQAEDFTRWNGGSDAAQIQLLEEALKAKLEGRDINSAEVQRKRQRLGARIRIVSLLAVVASVVGIAAGLNNIFNPREPEVVQTDLRAELLRLLAEGKLTPDQAIQLAQILEAGALGEQQASLQAPAESAPSAGSSIRSSESADVQLASVSEAEFEAVSRDTWTEAFTAVARHPNAEVRQAAVDMAVPERRDAAMQTLWTYAQNNPDDPQRAQIYLLCGAVGEQNNDPLGQRALEIATNLAPQDTGVWTMLSRSYQRTSRSADAQAAALVRSAVEARGEGQADVAEQRLQQALPQLSTPATRAVVASTLGAIAEQRQDYTAASARYAEAFRLQEQAVETAPPTAPPAQNLEVQLENLTRTLVRSGRTREACEQVREAQVEHDVEAPSAELAQQCERERIQLRPLRVAPRAERLQQQRVAPTGAN